MLNTEPRAPLLLNALRRHVHLRKSCLLFLLPLLINVQPAVASPITEISVWQGRFDATYGKVRGGDGYLGLDNASGALAWGGSYLLMSLSRMYMASGQPLYIRRAAEHARWIMSQRDRVRLLPDYRGVLGDVWSTRSATYSLDHKPIAYAWTVHSGMILFSLLEFAQTVRDHPITWHLASGEIQLIDLADYIVSEAPSSIAYHLDQMRGLRNIMRTRDPDVAIRIAGIDGRNRKLPVNMFTAFGRALLLLYDLDHNRQWYDLARSQCRLFHRRIRFRDGIATWHYWHHRRSPVEDLSHGAIAADFAVRCREHGLVFSQEELRAIGHAITRGARIDDHTFSRLIDGTDEPNAAGFVEQIPRWLRLARYDPELLPVVYGILESAWRNIQSGSLKPDGSTLLGIANFVYYGSLWPELLLEGTAAERGMSP